MKKLEIEEIGLYLCFSLESGQEARLLKVCSKKPEEGWEEKCVEEASRIVEIRVSGGKCKAFRGAKNFYDHPQTVLRYVRHRLTENESGRQLVISQEGDGLVVHTCYQFYRGLPVFSCESEVINRSPDEIWLEGVTSFCYGNLDYFRKGDTNPAEELELWYAHNTWSAECRWKRQTLQECGVIPYGNLCYDRFCISNAGGFSSGEFLPEGAAYNRRTGESIFWQIEHNGSWSWEIGCSVPEYWLSFLEKEYLQPVYLLLSGPETEKAHWYKKLKSRESFRTVPAAVSVSRGKPEEGISWMTQYRRRKKQIKKLPVIFNDYMNCLMGNSTTASLLPYIRKAGEAGCEIFVVDCGWYDSRDWQFTLGTFEECRQRYPAGLTEVMDCIRAAGMEPGLWLELESFGTDNPAAGELPKDWLFCRNGKPVMDSGRYQLDFRNADVRENASSIVKRVIEKYGLKYIKMDYNMCCGWGTDFHSDSLGDGLLEHNRAYLDWLEKEREKYPGILWENCASGGLRMDYALLSQMDIQSVSDQEDYRIMAFIASNCAAALLPEQAGIWCYPRKEGDCRETVMNLVSGMLFRIHLGGHLAKLDGDRFLLVKEGIACHKRIRQEIPESLPYWPLGMHVFDSPWLCWGLHGPKADYIAVCRRMAEEVLSFPVKRTPVSVRILYAVSGETEIVSSDPQNRRIQVRLEYRNSACLIEVKDS